MESRIDYYCGLNQKVILANHICLLGKQIAQPISQKSGKLANVKTFLTFYSRLLRPPFMAMITSKRLLLLFLGGVEKNLDNGTHLRG